MTVEPEITAQDDVSSDSNKGSEEKKAAADNSDDDDSKEGNHVGDNNMDALMNASDVITSMRTAIEDSIRNIATIEPPMPFFSRPKQRQHWGDIQVRRFGGME